MSSSDRADTIAIWDGPVRIVHWAIVGLIGFSWYSAENHLMDWHRTSGYAIVGLLVFRIIWGFVGSSTARFATFVKAPSTIVRHAGSVFRRSPGEGVGHNPVGAVSVLALLLVMLFQTVTGLFAVDVDGIESGPLSDRVSFDQGRWLADLHHSCFAVLQWLVVIHIAAILFYLLYKRDNLIGPMITGRRRANGIAGMARAPILNLVAASLVAGIAAWFVSKGLRL